jgi:hypothetical protein
MYSGLQVKARSARLFPQCVSSANTAHRFDPGRWTREFSLTVPLGYSAMRQLLSFLFVLTLTLSPALGQGYAGVKNILFLAKDNSLPGNVVVTYSSCSSMLSDIYGFTTSSYEYTACTNYYGGGGSGTVSYWRLSNGDTRARIYGGQLAPCGSYKSITNGALTYTMNGFPTTAGALNLSGVTNCENLASTIQTSINSAANLASASVIGATSTIKPQTACFKASIDQWVMTVTAMTPKAAACGGTSASIQLGGYTSCLDFPSSCKVVSQLDGVTGGKGDYIIYYETGEPQSQPNQATTETWGLLTVGNVISGTVGPSRVTGSGVAPDTGIISNLTGSGAGSTWVVNNAQSISGVRLTQTGFLSTVTDNAPAGGVTTLWIEPNNDETLETNTSFGGFPSRSSAGPLALTSATGAKEGFATLVPTGKSLSQALIDYRSSSNNQSFTAVQWIGDTPAQLTASQTSTWCQANSISYLQPPPPWGSGPD